MGCTPALDMLIYQWCSVMPKDHVPFHKESVLSDYLPLQLTGLCGRDGAPQAFCWGPCALDPSIQNDAQQLVNVRGSTLGT